MTPTRKRNILPFKNVFHGNIFLTSFPRYTSHMNTLHKDSHFYFYFSYWPSWSSDPGFLHSSLSVGHWENQWWSRAEQTPLCTIGSRIGISERQYLVVRKYFARARLSFRRLHSVVFPGRQRVLLKSQTWSSGGAVVHGYLHIAYSSPGASRSIVHGYFNIWLGSSLLSDFRYFLRIQTFSVRTPELADCAFRFLHCWFLQLPTGISFHLVTAIYVSAVIIKY